MKKIIFLSTITCYCLLFALSPLLKAQNQTDCVELPKKISEVFKDGKSVRITLQSPNDHLTILFEMDSLLHWHAVFTDYSKENAKIAIIGIGKIIYYSESETRVWSTEQPSTFIYTAQLEFLKKFKTIFEKNFSNCTSINEAKSTNKTYSSFTFHIDKDTFRTSLNKTTDRIENIKGVTNQNKFNCFLGLPLKIIEPTREASNDVNFGYTFFPPTFSETEESDSDDPIFVLPEKQPEYEGGYQNVVKILSENIKYPGSAKNAGVEGTVYVGFTIERNGSMTNFKIKRSVNKSLDSEAMRVVKLLGNNWIAGSNNGQKVRCAYVLPIKFAFK